MIDLQITCAPCLAVFASTYIYIALLLCSRVALASYVKGYRAAPDQGLRSGC